MTRWAKAGSSQRHKKLPEDPTPWEDFANERENSEQKIKAKKDKFKKKRDKFKKEKSEQNSQIVHPQEGKSEQDSQSVSPQKEISPEETSSAVPDVIADLKEDSPLEEPGTSASNKPKRKWKQQKKKQSFMDKVKEERLKNGILLLPPKAERKLYKMKKGLRNKGMPEDKIREILRQRRRIEELEFRKTLRTCFKCRQIGHILAECPLIANDSEQGTGICFKCGSTEHTSGTCPVKTEGFPFAKCFICHEQGHLSRSCPKNKHGAFPKGGRCKVCGEIDHLAKDCPSTKKDVQEEEITVGTISNVRSVDDEVIKEADKSNKIVSKKPKVVTF